MPHPVRRWIAHLDMDAFYASVELLRYPDLKGQPVVIGGGRRHQPELLPDGTHRYATLADYAGRGVITTATYAARDLGVHSGMGLMKAGGKNRLIIPPELAYGDRQVGNVIPPNSILIFDIELLEVNPQN